MEDRPIEAVINAAGEGNPLHAGNNPVISDTNESAGDTMIHSHHSESIAVNDVDPESRYDTHNERHGAHDECTNEKYHVQHP